jgi:cell division transport system permease protein
MTMTFAVIITVAISLTLLGVGFLANSQVRVMKDYWYDKIEVSVFLCGSLSESPSCSGGPITATARNAIENDLQALPVVQNVYYESRAQAFQHFQTQFNIEIQCKDCVKKIEESLEEIKGKIILIH